MTRRAIVLGLLVAAFIASFTYFNDWVMRQTSFIGDHMPRSVFGVLIFFVLAINPLIWLLRKKWAFRGSEIAVVLTMALVACAVPGDGLMRYFTTTMMAPHHLEKRWPDWPETDVLRMVPEQMLAGAPAELRADDIAAPTALAARFAAEITDRTPAELRIRERLSPDALGEIASQSPAAIARALNTVLTDESLYDAEAFPDIDLPQEAKRILKRGENRTLEERDYRELNRHLIDTTWPGQIYSLAARRNRDLAAFVTGVNDQAKPAKLSQIPWAAWKRPILFWAPIVLAMYAGVIGMALAVHRQWRDREHLPYPIARFAEAVLPDNDGRAAAVIRNRGFLVAALIMFLYHMMNYAAAVWPDIGIKIPSVFDFGGLQPIFGLEGGYYRWVFFLVRVYPTVIAIAYLVSSDVALSIGLSQIIGHLAKPLIFGWLTVFGSRALYKGCRLYTGSPEMAFKAGVYLAFAAMLAYAGRNYYRAVLRRVIGLKAKDDPEPSAVWGARVAIACAIFIAVYLTVIGIPWYMALLYVAIAYALYLALARIVAETGLYSLAPGWFPGVLILLIFGVRSVGAQTALLMFMVTNMLLISPVECLMPYIVNALHITDSQKIGTGRPASWAGAAVLLAFAVALPVTLMFQYGNGAVLHGWARCVPEYPFAAGAKLTKNLAAVGQAEPSSTPFDIERLKDFAPDPASLTTFGIGAILVILIVSARIRFRWWPFHPILIIGLYNTPCLLFWHSFLIGFALKKAVLWIGGQKLHQRVMPVIFGVVAGEMLGMMVPSIVGAICYAAGANIPNYVGPP